MRRNGIIVWIVYVLMRWMTSKGMPKIHWFQFFLSNALNLVLVNLFCWMADPRKMITWSSIWFIKCIAFGTLKFWIYQKFKIFYLLMIMLSARRNAHWLHDILLLHTFLQFSSTRWVFNISMFTSISCFYIKFFNFFNQIFLMLFSV